MNSNIPLLFSDIFFIALFFYYNLEIFLQNAAWKNDFEDSYLN